MTSFDASAQGMGSLAGVLLFLTTASVVLRFIARRMQKLSFGADGWCMIPAWLCFVGLASNAIYGMVHRLVAFPEPTDQTELLPLFRPFATIYYVADVFCIVSLGFTRISALFFYRRIFVVQGRNKTAFSVLTIFGIVVMSLWMLGSILLVIFVCGTNFEEFFTPKEVSSDCVAIPALKYFGITSFSLDFLVLILPIPKILTLQATTARKLSILGVFLFATAGVVASFARMTITLILLETGPSVGHEDTFLANTRLYYLLLLETGLVLTATNLPSLWYFFSNGKVPERLLRSFRSFISLGSIQSNSNQSRHIRKNASNDTASSHSGIETTHEYKVEYTSMS